MTATARQRAPWREQDWPLPRPATKDAREVELQAHRKRLRRAARSVRWRYRLRWLGFAQRVVVPLPRPGGRMGSGDQELFACGACHSGGGMVNATGVVVSYGGTETGCCDEHDPSRPRERPSAGATVPA